MMDLFEHAARYPEFPGYKEPSTSKDAAKAASAGAAGLRERVFEAIPLRWPGWAYSRSGGRRCRPEHPIGTSQGRRTPRNGPYHPHRRAPGKRKRHESSRVEIGTMTVILTEADRLTAIEAMIQKMNFARKQPGTNVHKQWLALRATATELRARQPATIDRATTALEAVLQDLSKSRDGNGRPTENQCRMVAETINGYWPVVRQALARFAQKPAPDPEDDYADRAEWKAARL